LLDEITTDLDLIARQDLLAFLREETESRGTTILYATHIFDTLDRWATDIIYMAAGEVVVDAPIADLAELAEQPLVAIVERWLRRDTHKP
jgi:CCR4-NOT complex subunit CAF16